jgi:hypothetical protein
MKYLMGCVVCIALVACGVPQALALYPSDKDTVRKDAEALEARFDQLFKEFVPYFSGQKKERLSGEEELGWRIHDFIEDLRALRGLLGKYYENEKKIDKLLDKMSEHARWIDEAFVYTAVPQKISRDWAKTRDAYKALEHVIRRKVSVAVSEKGEKIRFDVSKVNRVEKKYVLRELLSHFLGGSELDKFPFPEEKKYLDKEECGEHFIVTWDCAGMKRFDQPIILRFEYKFHDKQYDGFIEETYRDANRGSYMHTFKNIGEEYTKRGKIIHWRAVVIYDNKIVAEKKSPMWAIASR